MKSLLTFHLLDAVQFSDASGSLRTKSSGFSIVSKSRDFLLTLLDKSKGKSLDVGANDASSNRSSLSFSFSFGSVSLGAGLEEKSDSVVAEHSLFHGESVLVESSVDSEDVAFELLSKGIGLNFLTHPSFEEDSAAIVIIDIERFRGSVGGVGDAELHRSMCTFILCHKLINIILIIFPNTNWTWPSIQIHYLL